MVSFHDGLPEARRAALAAARPSRRFEAVNPALPERLGAARPALGGKLAQRFPNPKLLFMVQEPLREVRGELPQRRRSWLARGRDLPMAAAPHVVNCFARNSGWW